MTDRSQFDSGEGSAGTEEQRQITFFGRILPERTWVTLLGGPSQFELHEDSPDRRLIARLRIHIDAGQVVVRVDRNTVGDLSTLRNIVAGLVSSCVDALGYASGRRYEVEITGWDRVEDSGVFGVGMPALTVPEGDALAVFSVLFPLITNDPEGRARPLRRALADLREAIMNADDGPFYCFRAVESLTHAWARNSTKGMTPMCTALRLDRVWLRDTLERPAGALRHGASVSVSEESRLTTMFAARAIIERFAIYLLTGGPLQESQYPLLGPKTPAPKQLPEELLHYVRGRDALSPRTNNG